MKAVLLRRFILVAALAALTGAFAMTAQKLSILNDDNAAGEGLKSALQSFAKAEMIPALTTWKNRLDGTMTSADLSELNRLRAKAKELKTAFRAELKTMRKSWKSENYEALKQSRQKINDMKDERDELVEAVIPLAKKYKETLVEIGAEAKPVIEKWRKRGQEIVAEWQAKNPEADIPPGILLHAMKQWGLKKTGKKAAAIRFMLWDGGAEFGDAGSEPGLHRKQEQSGEQPQMEAMPNPFSTATTIRVTLPEDQHITLAVYDAAGRRIAVLAEGFYTEGEHSFRYEAPAEQAAGGQYCMLDNSMTQKTLPLASK